MGRLASCPRCIMLRISLAPSTTSRESSCRWRQARPSPVRACLRTWRRPPDGRCHTFCRSHPSARTCRRTSRRYPKSSGCQKRLPLPRLIPLGACRCSSSAAVPDPESEKKAPAALRGDFPALVAAASAASAARAECQPSAAAAPVESAVWLGPPVRTERFEQTRCPRRSCRRRRPRWR